MSRVTKSFITKADMPWGIGYLYPSADGSDSPTSHRRAPVFDSRHRRSRTYKNTQQEAGYFCMCDPTGNRTPI
jgi:hypothetical protein